MNVGKRETVVPIGQIQYRATLMEDGEFVVISMEKEPGIWEFLGFAAWSGRRLKRLGATLGQNLVWVLGSKLAEKGW